MSPVDDSSSADSADRHARLEALLTRAKAGSTSALGRALSLCRPRLLRTARKGVAGRLRHEAGASDVVQDTFVNATKGFGGFRGRRAGEFVGWLCAILANRLAEIARRTSRGAHRMADSPLDGEAERCLRLLPDDAPSPSSLAGHQEYSDMIRAALAGMSARDQQVLNLRFEAGLTFGEIGRRLELSEDAARMLFTRAVKRLRRRLPVHLEVH